MEYKHGIITNIPKNPRDLFDYAKSKSNYFNIDEKGTEKHPSVWQRKDSDLSYDEAYKIIEGNTPHWVISFRNNSYFGDEDYWEFGGCNIGSNDYGSVFIWINVEVEVALEIFKEFKLEVKEY